MEYYVAIKRKEATQTHAIKVDDPWKHDGEWKKPETKAHVYDPIDLNV